MGNDLVLKVGMDEPSSATIWRFGSRRPILATFRPYPFAFPEKENMPILAAGDQAPAFTLLGSASQTFSLADYAGHPLVLFFYPKDDTSGCTSEAVAFTALKGEFDTLGVRILGISPDSPASHDKFIKKHALGVDLASSEDHAMLEAYGVWTEKSMYGKKYMGVERTTLLIGGDGVIRVVWPKVKVPGHAEAVLNAARAL
jgi:thioredoxin-dependent peroxiredoxin